MQNRLKLPFILCFLLLVGVLFSQESKTEKKAVVKWISLEKAQELTKKNPKKILVDVYTKWCGPCKMMMSQTFTDPVVVKYINENFYAVKFNAESKASVTYKDSTYTNPKYDPNRKGRNATHTLTYNIAATQKGIAYPTIVYMDSQANIISPVQGLWRPAQILPLLHFINEDRYKTVTWPDYQKQWLEKQQTNKN